MMLSSIKQPTKNGLVKNIQFMKNPKIDVVEVLGRKDRNKVITSFDKMVSKGNFSVVFIQE